MEKLEEPSREILTVVVRARPDEYNDKSIVKAALAFSKDNPNINDIGRALYFSRACIPFGDTNIWHHVGIYAWKRKTLQKSIIY